jgi:hypothetical protein
MNNNGDGTLEYDETYDEVDRENTIAKVLVPRSIIPRHS